VPDQAQATFIQVDAQGKATYVFEGKIVAEGLTLQEAGEIAGSQQFVAWLEGETERERIYGQRFIGGNHRLVLEALGGINNAILRLDSNAKLGGAGISALAGGNQFLIINNEAESTFVRNPTSANRVQNRGIAELSWTAGNKMSAVLTVSHGLGAIPVSVNATMLITEAVAEPITAHVIAGSLTSTTFKLRGGQDVVFGANATLQCSWTAET